MRKEELEKTYEKMR